MKRLLTIVTGVVFAALIVAGGDQAAQAADTGSISGKVTGVGDAALDAYVYAYNFDTGSSVGWGYTDAAGNYTMSSLPAGRYRVQFSSSGYTSEYWDNVRTSANATAVTVTAGTTTPNISAQLDANPTISGTVTDADGNKLQGVTVSISNPSGGTSTTTNANGTYSYSYLPSGDDYTIRFTPPSGTPWLGEYWDNKTSALTADTFDLTPGQQFTADAQLARGAQIKGTVTSNGTNLSGIGVVVRQGYEVVASGRTAADGTYASTGLPPGVYKVSFGFAAYGGPEQSNYLPEWYDDQQSSDTADTVTIPGSADVPDIDADLALGGTITGTVTAPDNSSAASVQVSAAPVGSGSSVSTMTGTDGTYSITGLRSGQYVVRFGEYNSSGYAPQWWQNAATAASATSVTVTEGTTTAGINAKMWSGASISGTVTDSNGNPVYNASISSQSPTYRSTSTDPNGKYTLNGLAEGDHRLQINAPYGSALLGEYWDNQPDSASADLIPLTRGQAVTGKDAVLAKGGQISGTVSGPSGPVSGVSVYASQGWNSSTYATTGPDGTYTLKGLRGGSYTISFSPQGNDLLSEYYDNATSSEQATPVPVTLGGEVTGIDATLASASTISGIVKTSTGVPVAGTYVSAEAPNGGYGSAQTAADGTYTIGRLRAGSYTVSFGTTGKLLPQWYDHQASRSAANPVVLGTDEDKTGINADLEPGQVITGTVTDEQDIPLAGVSVSVYTADSWNYVASATTDGAGKYSTTGLPAGTYKVEFYPYYLTDYLREWYNNAASFDQATRITIGATDQVADAKLGKASFIEGTVKDTQGGSVSGYVSAYTLQGDHVAGSSIYSDGTYSLRVPAGTYQVEFNAYGSTGLLDEWWDNQRSSATADSIVIGKDQTQTADAVLEPGGVITGTVKDPQNNPVPGVRVTAYGDRSASATTQADGTYRIVGLAPDDYQVRFRGVGDLGTQWYNGVRLRRDATNVPVALSATVSDINAILRPAQLITGTVATSGGQPIGDVQVSVYKKGAGYYTDSAYTDAAGNFRTQQLPDGDYELRLRPRDNSEWAMQWYNGSSSRQRATTVTLSGGQSTSIAATLQRGGSLSGTVTGSGDAPLAGVYVSASNGREYRYTTTGADGTYQIQGLLTGQYTVEFDANSNAGVLDEWYDNATDYDDATLVPVIAGEDTPDIDAAMTLAGSISGTVTSGGNPAPWIELAAYRDGEYYGYTYSGQDGTYRFPTLEPGTYKILAYGEGALARQWWQGASSKATATEIPVNGQAVTGKDFALVAGGSISGTLQTFEGTSPGRGWVYIDDEDGGWAGSGPMESDGTFRIEGLAPGSYRVEVNPYDYPTIWWRDGDSEATSELVTVAAGADTPLAMKLPQLSSITGTVKDGNGNPVGAEVGVYRIGEEDSFTETSTAADGSYTVRGLRTGSYQIRFMPLSGDFASQWWNGAARRSSAQTAIVGATPFTANAVVVKGGTLSGIITDESNQPVAGAQVRAYFTPERYVRAVSDATGQYLFTGLDDAEYRLYAAPGSSRLDLVGTWLGGADYGTATNVSVGNGSSVVRNVALQRGAAVSGRVTDNNGQPVQGIGVDLFDQDGRKSLTAWTGADGRYMTSGLRAGTYTARFMPGYYGGDGLAEQWWNDQPRFKQATQFTLTAQQQRTGVDATLRPIKAGTTAPGTPRDVVVTPGNRKVTLRWSVPASNGGLTITRYKVTGTPTAECQTLGELTCTIEGLTNGTAYEFSVQAANTVGLSSPSAPVSAVPFGKPSAPASVGATGGVERASVTWAAADGNGRPVTQYTVTASPSGRSCTSAGTTCDVAGLPAGSYTFTVVATNEAGASDSSAASGAVTVTAAGGGGPVTPPAGGGGDPVPPPSGGGSGSTPPPASPPAAPAAVKATVKKRKLTVTWSAVPGATSYQVRVNRKGKPGKWKTATTPKLSAKLSKGKYTVEVKAVGAGGSSPVKRVSVKVK